MDSADHARFQSLVTAAEALISTTRKAGQVFLQAVTEDKDTNAAKIRWLNAVKMQNGRAIRMLGFPMSEPQLFAAFDAIATFTALHPATELMDPTSLSGHARDIDEKLQSFDSAIKLIAQQYREQR